MNYSQTISSEKVPGTSKNLHFFTGRASKSYVDVEYGEDDYLVFGRESRGIDEGILQMNEERCVRIPMAGGMRSLNLSNSVAIAVYEVLRRSGFAGLS